MIHTFFEDVVINVIKTPGALGDAVYPAADAYIDVSDYERVAFLIALGATDQAVDMEILQATAAAGTDSKAVTGAKITQLTAAEGDDTWALIELQTEKLDINHGFHFVAASVDVTGGSAATGTVIFFGLNPGSRPVVQPADFVEQVLVAGP